MKKALVIDIGGTKIYNTVINENGEIIAEIEEMNQTLKLKKEDIIEKIRKRIENPEKTHAKELEDIIKHKGYIPSQVSIAEHNKETSYEELDI